ncbi:AAA family ATPase [Pedobacter sp. MC2016-15]|uniref:ATP-binding protein n=1 Tax=Pedobacter sp. MC2016-15 TaxID=2994473 RepID=UPI00224621F9|nr:AAA family ATPase [Pedobacter sp. MC2016-15]MCX2481034.1 AAA family ATPase [Pedobacter sp. MC2016-15]
MFHRDIINELIAWKESSGRKPLLLRGARQVGKTTVINMFSKHYQQYIYLNLEQADQSLDFSNYGNVERLTEQIFFIFNKDISLLKNTLLFIDEIQDRPGALNMLRYFYEKIPDLHVVGAGSLLETAINGQTKIPVGRVEYKILRPVSFHEFLLASQEDQAAIALLETPIKEFTHQKLLSLFHTYTLIGGMPEVIRHYVENKNLQALSDIYQSLIYSYIEDVEKYGRNDNSIQIIRHIIRASFLEAGNRIKFQGFGNSGYGSREVSAAMQTLQKVMIIQLLYPTTNTNVPLLPDIKKSPRLQVLDTGMLNFFAGLQKELILTKDIDHVYKGKIAEHIVAQELLAAKYNVLNELHFWVREKKSSTAEVDFVILYNSMIIPVEVKAGATGTLKSLHSFIDEAEHSIGVRIYGGPLKVDRLTTLKGKDYTLLNLPFYLTSRIEIYLDWMINTNLYSSEL